MSNQSSLAKMVDAAPLRVCVFHSRVDVSIRVVYCGDDRVTRG